MSARHDLAPRRRARLVGLVLALALAATACAGSDDGESADDATGTTVAPTTTVASTTTTEPDVVVGEWEQVAAPAPCVCSDGSPFHYWVREGAPDKVLFFLDGGGACFSAETCRASTATYRVNLGGDGAPADAGIFDPSDPDNPLADHSIVFVPYCTGDLHLGAATHDYGEGVVVEHRGSANGTAALAAAVELFPDAGEVVVAGSSAGSAGAPLYGGLAHDAFPEADVAVVADASAAYPGTPEITLAIGGLWGIGDALPPWPETADLPLEAWSLPGLFVAATLHHPDIRFATFNDAFDSVQAQFTRLIGGDPTRLDELIVANNAWIDDQGVDAMHWVSPGTGHTILGSDELYDEVVDGVSFVEWLAAFLAGDEVDDVRCTGCEPPAG